MHDGTVQALGIILDDQLPVCLEMINAPFHHLEFCHAPWRELAVKPSQMLVEWNRTRGKIDENVAVPKCGRYGVQRIVRFAETLDFFHVRRVGQRAVEFVSPGVILALNAASELSFILLQSMVPRWRQTLWKARMLSWSSRVMITLALAIWRR